MPRGLGLSGPVVRYVAVPGVCGTQWSLVVVVLHDLLVDQHEVHNDLKCLDDEAVLRYHVRRP